MKAFIENLKELVWIAGLGVVVLIWLNDRYATADELHRVEGQIQKRQEEYHAEEMKAIERVSSDMVSLRESARIISQRVFDLAKEHHR